MNMMDQPWQSIELPYGWEMKFDPGRKKHFFLDHINKTTTWEDPRIKVWTAKQATTTAKNKATWSAMKPDAREDQIQSKFPSVGKEIISMVLNSSDGDIGEACEVLKEMGYKEKQAPSTADNLFHTLSLLTRPDTLSPKNSSSVPLETVKESSVRSSSPCSSVAKAKSSHSETNSTISNSSEEDKKKGEKKSSTVHKHNQHKKKTDKKESHHGNGKAGHSSSKHDHHTGLPQKYCGTSSTQTSVEQKEEDEDSKVNSNHPDLRKFVSVSIGPNKSLARGPDINLLNSDRPPAYEGHNPALCSGPSPGNACGPQKDLYKGPQASLLSADTI